MNELINKRVLEIIEEKKLELFEHMKDETTSCMEITDRDNPDENGWYYSMYDEHLSAELFNGVHWDGAIHYDGGGRCDDITGPFESFSELFDDYLESVAMLQQAKEEENE